MPEWECKDCGLKSHSKCVWDRGVFPEYSDYHAENELLKLTVFCKEENKKDETYRDFRLQINIEWGYPDPEEGGIDREKEKEDFYYRTMQTIIDKKLLKKLYCRHNHALVDSEKCDIDETHPHPIKKKKVEE